MQNKHTRTTRVASGRTKRQPHTRGTIPMILPASSMPNKPNDTKNVAPMLTHGAKRLWNEMGKVNRYKNSSWRICTTYGYGVGVLMIRSQAL